MIIDAMHRKSHFADGDRGSRATVPCLIAWQHEDIALKTKTGDPGISAEILTQTKQLGRSMCQRVGRFGPAGARCDLVFVFDRPSGRGPTTGFTFVPRQLLAGDLHNI
jgi:hypothetical protein